MSGISVSDGWEMKSVLESSLVAMMGTGKGIDVTITNITSVSTTTTRKLLTDDPTSSVSSNNKKRVMTSTLSSILLTWITTFCAEVYGISDPALAYAIVSKDLTINVQNNTFIELLQEADAIIFANLKVLNVTVSSYNSKTATNHEPTVQPTGPPASDSVLSWFKQYFYVVIIAFVVLVALVLFIRQCASQPKVSGNELDQPVDFKLTSIRDPNEAAEIAAEREKIKDGVKYMIKHLYDNKQDAPAKARQIVNIVNSSTVLNSTDLEELSKLANVSKLSDLVASVDDENGMLLPNLHRMGSLESMRNGPNKPGLQISTNENIMMAPVEDITTPQKLEQGMAIAKLYSSISSSDMASMGQNEMISGNRNNSQPSSKTFSKPRSVPEPAISSADPDASDGFIRPTLTRKNTLKLDEVYKVGAESQTTAVTEANPLGNSMDRGSRKGNRSSRQKRRLVSSSVDGTTNSTSVRDPEGANSAPHRILVAKPKGPTGQESEDVVVATVGAATHVRRHFTKQSRRFEEGDSEDDTMIASDTLPRPSVSPMSKSAISRALKVQLQEHREHRQHRAEDADDSQDTNESRFVPAKSTKPHVFSPPFGVVSSQMVPSPAWSEPLSTSAPSSKSSGRHNVYVPPTADHVLDNGDDDFLLDDDGDDEEDDVDYEDYYEENWQRSEYVHGNTRRVLPEDEYDAPLYADAGATAIANEVDYDSADSNANVVGGKASTMDIVVRHVRQSTAGQILGTAPNASSVELDKVYKEATGPSSKGVNPLIDHPILSSPTPVPAPLHAPTAFTRHPTVQLNDVYQQETGNKLAGTNPLNETSTRQHQHS